MVLGFLASVIVFYAYLVQKLILYVGYALAPIFIAFLAGRNPSARLSAPQRQHILFGNTQPPTISQLL